ncbi:CidA/LrgA family protein [Thalassomonas viridans]|uniref:CidA/LrgA family protein n=1 Tax=Thalassomonas viridans TaxID=137584 RepID=A0AAE9Z0Y9_9GAMM|nr:CidA/LrgA family protein [Thalassomonas viridans]WDE04040.1 CidA/LrgA family protein [Thalassomonas viridans]
MSLPIMFSRLRHKPLFIALYSLFAIAVSLAAGKLLTATLGGLPGSLHGMIIFTALLHFQVFDAQIIKPAITWIIQHMGVCFVPAGVGIINHFELIKQHGLTIVAIIFITTFILLTFVGLCCEYFCRQQNTGKQPEA